MSDRNSVDDVLADLETLYRRYKNPLFAWWAIHIAKGTGTLPEWCSEYLGACALDLVDLALHGRGSPVAKAAKISDALKMVRRGYNCFKSFDVAGLDIRIAATIADEKARGESKLIFFTEAGIAVEGKSAKSRVSVESVVSQITKQLGVARSTVYDRAARAPDLPHMGRGARKKH